MKVKNLMKVKRTICLLLSVAILCAAVFTCAFGMTGCGGRRISGTYEKVYDSDFITKRYDMFDGGVMFFFAVVMTGGQEVNSVEMRDDGTYVYTKLVTSTPDPETAPMRIELVFEGNYSDGSSEDSYVLGKPKNATWSSRGAAGIGFNDGEDKGMSDVLTTAGATVMDYFCGEALLRDPVEGRADRDIWIEISLTDAEGEETGTLAYVDTNSVYDIY